MKVIYQGIKMKKGFNVKIDEMSNEDGTPQIDIKKGLTTDLMSEIIFQKY